MEVRTCLSTIFGNLVRKKDFTADLMRKDLRKVLHLSDLTFLAIGSMIGSGLYVLTGKVAHDTAGPSIVISYALAAVASVLSAVCYAEFAARIPITGSAYQFTYLSIGEIWAFIIGWNVFLEHTVLAASIAKGWSGYVDAMFDHPIEKYLTDHLPMAGGLVATYPDFLAGCLVIVLTIVVALGVKISSKVNILLAVLNLLVILFIFGTGMILAKGENWTASGAFFPHGWSGTISGAATLIFSYVGYEVVASATEEAVNPKRDVPLSLLISLSVVVVAYVGASTALTLMVPWQEIAIASPFPSAYQTRGLDWAKYVVSVGALAAMTAAMLSALLVVPRYLYAMARDGLIIPLFRQVNETTGVPVLSTLLSGALCVILAMVFSLGTLVEFISIGQLLACTFVSICVVKLRHGPNDLSSYETLHDETPPTKGNDADIQLSTFSSTSTSGASGSTAPKTEETPLSLNKTKDPQIVTTTTQYQTELITHTDQTGMLKKSIVQSQIACLFTWTQRFAPGDVPFYALLIAILFSSVATAMLLFGYQHINEAWFIILLTVSIAIAFLSLLFITAFNQDETIKTYKVPFVPFTPFASIVINVILILKLQSLTWVRFAVWMAVGLLIYFGYGYRHSHSRKQE